MARWVVVALVGCICVVSPSVRGDELLVTAQKGASIDIWLVNVETGAHKRLTDHPSRNYGACWSPDGERIAFCSDRDGTPNIYIMNADGTNLTQVTKGKILCGYPSWSPDGKRLVYCAHYGNPHPIKVIVMNIDGSNPQILSTGAFGDDAWDPAWSPDGTKIVFTGYRGAKSFGLFTMDANGKNVRQLYVGENRIGNVYPAWSPDGKRIAFVDFAGMALEVFLINSDGSNLKKLTNLPGIQLYPTWSPDGKRVAYRRYDGNTPGAIYIVDASSGEGAAIKTPPSEGAYGDRVAWRPRR